MKRHKCSATREAHAVARVTSPEPGHKSRNGARCHCHGHCGICGKPVLVCKMGRFHHTEEG